MRPDLAHASRLLLQVWPGDAGGYKLKLRRYLPLGIVGAGTFKDEVVDRLRPLIDEYVNNLAGGDPGAKHIGQELYKCLVSDNPDLARVWEVAAGDPPLRLTVEFAPNTDQLAALPLELLHDQEGHVFIRPGSVLTRSFMETRMAPFALPVGRKPRLLFAWACPQESGDPFDGQAVGALLKSLPWLEYHELPNASYPELAERLRGESFDFLHLQAHGFANKESGSCGVYLDKGNRVRDDVTADRLALVLREPTSLVFLCSCKTAKPVSGHFSAVGQRLLSNTSIPSLSHVVAMQAVLPITKCGVLSQRFYQALEKSGSPEGALSEVRRELYAERHNAWSVPVLLSRPSRDPWSGALTGSPVVSEKGPMPPTEQLGALHRVPEVPDHFLPRVDRVDPLIASLRAERSGSGAARVVLHGMGGIGKSVLAAAAARDRRIREAFPDGIAWVKVGQEPNIPALQLQAYHDLGGKEAIVDNQARPSLAKHLESRAVLLILDNVWKRPHVDAFDVPGPRCRMLITTRNERMLQSPSCPQHFLDVLSEAEAGQLLGLSAGLSPSELPNESGEILAECGGLPLAVALCGGLLRDGMAAQRIVQQLQQARIDRIAALDPDGLVEEHHRSVWDAIHVSVADLPDDKRRRFLDLAVFANDAPTPAAAVATLWSDTDNLDRWDTDVLLKLLSNRSLLTFQTDAEAPRIELHDLIHDYLRHATPDLAPLHSALVRAYRARCGNGWASGPNDGYFFTHIPEHLFGAGRDEEVYELARDDAFLRAQAEALPNQPDLPLRTLQTALAVANKRDDPARMAELSLRHARWAHAIRSATILSALNAGELERALNAASLLGDEEMTLYRLLLAWELCEGGKRDAARDVLGDLLGEQPPRLRDWENFGALVLAHLVEVDKDLIVRLSSCLLKEDSDEKQEALKDWQEEDVHPRVRLLRHLLARGFIAEVDELVPLLLSTQRHCNDVYQRIAFAQVGAGNFDGAKVSIGRSGRPSWVVGLAIAGCQAPSDPGSAARTLAEAADEANFRPAKDELLELLKAITRSFLERQQVADLLGVVGTIKNGRLQDMFYCAAAIVFAERGDFGFARYIVKQNLDSTQHFMSAALARRALVRAQAEAGQLSEAEKTARQIKYKPKPSSRRPFFLTAYDRTLAECAIARRLAGEGQRERASERFTFARDQVATKVADEKMRIHLFCEVGVAQLEAGLFPDAGRTVKLMEDALEGMRKTQGDKEQYQTLRSDCLARVAIAQIRAGLTPDAMRTAQSRIHADFLLRVLKEIVVYQLQHDSLEAALETAKTKKEHQRVYDLLLATIATGLAQQQEWDAAVQVVADGNTGIDDKSTRMDAWLEIAAAQAVHGLTRKSRQLIAEKLLHQSLDVREAWHQASALVSIGKAQAKNQQIEQARSTFAWAKHVVREGSFRAKNRLRGLREVQIAQQQCGFDDATATLEEIYTAIRDYPRNAVRWIVEETALDLARSGQIDDALALSGAVETVRVVNVFPEIALMQAGCGNHSGARDNFNLARRRIPGKRGGRSKSLCTLASRMIQAGPEYFTDAANVLDEAEAALREDSKATQRKGLPTITSQRMLIGALEVLGAGKSLDESVPALVRVNAWLSFVTNPCYQVSPERKREVLDQAFAALLAIKGCEDWLPLMAALARARIGAGMVEETKALLPHLRDGRTEGLILAAIGLAHARARQGALAVKTAREISIDRQAYLPPIATALAGVGDREHFRQLLLPCSYFLDTAIRLCGDLAFLYPEASAELAGIVAGTPVPITPPTLEQSEIARKSHEEAFALYRKALAEPASPTTASAPDPGGVSWDGVGERYPPKTIITGVVRNLTNYGAFIEIEEGISGLLHISDMSWVRRVAHPSEMVSKGDKVTCVVLNVDQDRKRIALGLKQMIDDPWESDIPGRYQPGAIMKGKVTKLVNFGVFVELEPGLEGLLHISELADHKVESPEDVVKVGDEIEVKVLRVDAADRKIGLGRRQPTADRCSPGGRGDDVLPLSRFSR